MSPAPNQNVLQLAYEQAIEERDRLREARAFFARQLGPLPAFAGVTLAAVGAFSDKIENCEFFVAAVVVFGLLVLVSINYSRMPAYRQIRASKECMWRNELRQKFGVAPSNAQVSQGMRVEDLLTPSQWYWAQVELERRIYGEARTRNRIWQWPWPNPNKDLQDQLDLERTGVFVSQFLFVFVIVLLVLARA